jgi:hypothetical protein
MAESNLVDPRTGLGAGLTFQPQIVNTRSEPSSVATSSSGVTDTTGTQQQTQQSYALNTTPEILQAINNLIGSLSDGATVAAQKYPNAVAKTNWLGQTIYVHPTTGVQFNDPKSVQLFNEKQAALQQEHIKTNGGGGSATQRETARQRQAQIVSDIAKQKDFTPEKAQALAEGLSSYYNRVLTEGQLPGILRAAEGAGTSQGTTRALLTQQAIQRTSEVASKTGADLSVAFGGLSNDLAKTLEALTREDPNSISNQLIQAIVASKGLVSSSSSTGSQNTQQQQKTAQDQTVNKSAEVSTQQKLLSDIGNLLAGGSGNISGGRSNSPSAAGAFPDTFQGTPNSLDGNLNYIIAHDPGIDTTSAVPQAADISYYGGNDQFF